MCTSVQIPPRDFGVPVSAQALSKLSQFFFNNEDFKKPYSTKMKKEHPEVNCPLEIAKLCAF